MPKFPSNVEDLEYFPYEENNFFEYKSGIRLPIQKVYETLVGFLNQGGGYMIFGILDKSRRIVGVNSSYKDIDNFILKIDAIFHQGIIKTHNGSKLTHENLDVNIINMNTCRNPLIVITVKPTLFTSYMLSRGTVIHRVNASNHCILRSNTSDRTYTEDEHRELMNQQHQQLRLTFMSEIARTRSYQDQYRENVQKVLTSLRLEAKKLKVEKKQLKALADMTKETFMESMTWFDVAKWAWKKCCCSSRRSQ